MKPSALVVYDKVDGVRVLPRAGLARVGGAVFPKGYQQFEAMAFNNGPDGKPNTSDDWHLGAGRRDVECRGVHGDVRRRRPEVRRRDRRETGLFTPNVDGPNPDTQRQSQQHR